MSKAKTAAKKETTNPKAKRIKIEDACAAANCEQPLADDALCAAHLAEQRAAQTKAEAAISRLTTNPPKGDAGPERLSAMFAGVGGSSKRRAPKKNRAAEAFKDALEAQAAAEAAADERRKAAVEQVWQEAKAKTEHRDAEPFRQMLGEAKARAKKPKGPSPEAVATAAAQLKAELESDEMKEALLADLPSEAKRKGPKRAAWVNATKAITAPPAATPPRSSRDQTKPLMDALLGKGWTVAGITRALEMPSAGPVHNWKTGKAGATEGNLAKLRELVRLDAMPRASVDGPKAPEPKAEPAIQTGSIKIKSSAQAAKLARILKVSAEDLEAAGQLRFAF